MAGSGTSGNLPPYVSFATLEDFLIMCARKPVVGAIDHVVMDRFTPSVRAQLRPALRSLGLIDTAGKPSPVLKRLAESVGTGHYANCLAEMLDKAFPGAAELNLAVASPSELGAAIAGRECSTSVLKRSMRFYLSASIAAERQIGPRLQFGRRMRVADRSRQTRSVADSGSSRSQRDGANARRTTVDQMLQKLPDFDPNWASETQEIWMRCFERGLRAATRRS